MRDTAARVRAVDRARLLVQADLRVDVNAAARAILVVVIVFYVGRCYRYACEDALEYIHEFVFVFVPAMSL